jgi:hypothetical protein
MSDQFDPVTQRLALIERQAQEAAEQPQWLGKPLDTIRRTLIGRAGEEIAAEATRLESRVAIDVDAHLRPYHATDAVAAELHGELVRTAIDQLNGVADHVAIQRSVALRLFVHFDRMRDRVKRGQTVDVEELRALGASIATAVSVLQETIAERNAPVAEPVAA